MLQLTASLLIVWLTHLQTGAGISCYECSSHNMSDPHCEDPMSPAHSLYDEECQVPKEGHIGRFPGKFCVKVIGESTVTREKLVLRRCILEDMNSQCGMFKFENVTMHGCILTCNHDGCNRGNHLSSGLATLFFAFLVR